MINRNAAPAWANTRVSATLGIKYPIIQGALGGFASQRLTAAVSNYGGLGSFGAHGLPPSAIKDVIAELRSKTDKPFAMNLWVSMEDEGEERHRTKQRSSEVSQRSRRTFSRWAALFHPTRRIRR